MTQTELEIAARAVLDDLRRLHDEGPLYGISCQSFEDLRLALKPALDRPAPPQGDAEWSNETARLLGWLRWRSEWMGAPGPRDKAGTAWYVCAMRGDAAPSLAVEPQEKRGGDPRDPTPAAERDVLTEREKQRAKWGDAHDDEHAGGELGEAAAKLAHSYNYDPTHYGLSRESRVNIQIPCPEWVGTLRVRHDRRGRLVIAAALLLAEIERLDRAAARAAAQEGGRDRG